MRFIFCTFLFLSIHKVLFSQDTLIIYYNKNWVEISDKNQASFYRKAFKDSNNIWTAYDYYISNKLQMSGKYKSKKLIEKNGHFIYYYENGKKKIEGDYLNDKQEGEWITWYENGQQESKGKFKHGMLDGKWIYWYDNGMKESEGSFLDNFIVDTWVYWYDTGEKLSEGKFSQGVKDGTWQYFYKNGKTKIIEKYKSGLLYNSIQFYDNGSVERVGSYVSGKNQGKWSYWNIDGKKYLEGNYAGGNFVGKWVRYLQNGDSIIVVYDNMGFLLTTQLGGILKNE